MWQNMDAKMCLRLHDQDLGNAMRAARRTNPARAGATAGVGSASVPFGRAVALLRAVAASMRSAARAVRRATGTVS